MCSDPGVSHSSTSISLLDRAKLRDQAAWSQLVALYAPLVYRECRVMGVPAQDAPDVVQDTFGKVAANLGRFHRDRAGDSFRAWLATIARNSIRDYFKKRAGRPVAVGGTSMYRRVQELRDLDATESTICRPSDANPSIVQRAIHGIRGEFEDHTWEAFWMTVVDDRSPVDVAQKLGVSIWVVYQAKSRVLRRLRKELEGLLE